MLEENVLTEESQAIPEISPELLAKLKKADMQQAVVERFSSKSEASAAGQAARHGAHSPNWRPTDEEC
jgi:hypothetical protein